MLVNVVLTLRESTSTHTPSSPMLFSESLKSLEMSEDKFAQKKMRSGELLTASTHKIRVNVVLTLRPSASARTPSSPMSLSRSLNGSHHMLGTTSQHSHFCHQCTHEIVVIAALTFRQSPSARAPSTPMWFPPRLKESDRIHRIDKIVF